MILIYKRTVCKEQNQGDSMIYPYMTLNDETEICCSGIQDDGSVKVYVEKPDNNCGLKSMVCVLPGYEVKENYKFSENELSCILDLIKKNAHVIMDIAREGI